MGKGFEPSPSVQFVLELLRARAGAEVRLGPVPPMAEVMTGLKLAGFHGVGGALAEGLRKAELTGHPWAALQPFLDDLEARAAASNATLKTRALATAGELERSGIPCVFLKGAALVLSDSEASRWRSITDIDVLVPSGEVEAAAHALLSAGYVLTGDPSLYRQKYHHHYAGLIHSADGILVELHVRLMKNFRDCLVSSDDVFNRAIRIWTGAVEVLIPCAEHRLAHLVAHAQISNWGYVLRQISLRDLVEARELVDRQDIDWSEIRKAFQCIDACDELEGFLWVLREVFGHGPKLPELETGRGAEWAQTALKSLHSPPKPWTMRLRILRQYITKLIRDPARSYVVWQTVRNAARLNELVRTNKQRIWRQ